MEKLPECCDECPFVYYCDMSMIEICIKVYKENLKGNEE